MGEVTRTRTVEVPVQHQVSVSHMGMHNRVITTTETVTTMETKTETYTVHVPDPPKPKTDMLKSRRATGKLPEHNHKFVLPWESHAYHGKVKLGSAGAAAIGLVSRYNSLAGKTLKLVDGAHGIRHHLPELKKLLGQEEQTINKLKKLFSKNEGNFEKFGGTHWASKAKVLGAAGNLMQAGTGVEELLHGDFKDGAKNLSQGGIGLTKDVKSFVESEKGKGLIGKLGDLKNKVFSTEGEVSGASKGEELASEAASVGGKVPWGELSMLGKVAKVAGPVGIAVSAVSGGFELFNGIKQHNTDEEVQGGASVLGAGLAGAGLALDMTGIGAPVGVALNIAGAGLMIGSALYGYRGQIGHFAEEAGQDVAHVAEQGFHTAEHVASDAVHTAKHVLSDIGSAIGSFF